MKFAISIAAAVCSLLLGCSEDKSKAATSQPPAPVLYILPEVPSGLVLYETDYVLESSGAYDGFRENAIQWDGDLDQIIIPDAWSSVEPEAAQAAATSGPWREYKDDSGSFRFHDVRITQRLDGLLLVELVAWQNNYDNVAGTLSITCRPFPAGDG